MKEIKFYQVGGCVRDLQLGLPIHDRDWVVVGATHEWMLQHGFIAVGRGFPVYLHPKTKEEYALARTEQKVLPGYRGFTVSTAANVSLEEDLKRRDLTINAIALDENGKLIDLYGGMDDLNSKTLRHISAAFIEDPLRVLRVARFAAYLHPLGFSIHPATLQLMQTISQGQELSILTPERIWQEFFRALHYNDAWIFIEVLQQCHALTQVFQFTKGQQLLPMLEVFTRSCHLSDKPIIRFAAFCLSYSLNLEEFIIWCRRHAIPKEYYRLVKLIILWQNSLKNIMLLSATEILDLLHAVDIFRKPTQIVNILLVLDCLNIPNTFQQKDNILRLVNSLRNVKITDLNAVDIAAVIRQLRLDTITNWQKIS